MEQFRSQELGSILWAISRLDGSTRAWQLFSVVDRRRQKVGMTGIGAMLSISERGTSPSKRSLLKELRLLLRCRGDVQHPFVVVAALRAAEAGNAEKALYLLDIAATLGHVPGPALQMRRACGAGIFDEDLQ
mmetsp:Transcript_55360/g.129138  ORF Transcript_55360/g.129138 Transcript_55360/m.129138 type:complete len:132 (+) Transcript_55360:142-537(+)